MEFFTYSKDKRPIRLSRETRKFAYDSLQHKYGIDTIAVPAASMDDVPGYDDKSTLEQYDACIARIAEQARIRICPNEKLSGAATFGMAIEHYVPATRHGEKCFLSVSHLTLDFDTVVKKGVSALEEQVRTKLKTPGLTKKQIGFLESCLSCIASMRVWHKRYLEALENRPKYASNYRNLLTVPFSPAKNFYEAVQSIWFTFAFTRLCGNWPGIGRIDAILGDYLKKDLANGTITIEEAREILAHFLIKGCEWITGKECGSGDAQHYQNLVLAGTDENGHEVTNEVTYLILDVLEELGISDFPTSIRLNADTDRMLLVRVAEVMKHGGGILAVYNEETVIRAMETHGYTTKEARSFANDGCWEMQVPGKTCFMYSPVDALEVLLDRTLKIADGTAHFDTFEQVREAFYNDLHDRVNEVVREAINERTVAGSEWTWATFKHCTVVSLFEGSCVERAASYYEGGTDHTVLSPHIGGAADAGNSLLAIDRLCFKEKRISLDDLLQVLKNNWEGAEALRMYALNKIVYYGNDNDEADAYTVDVVNTFARFVLEHDGRTPIRFVPGISTFGRQIEWRNNRTASPHGHRTGDILAPNMGATPGTDMVGATALIKSYCKLNLTEQVTGAALDLKILPSCVEAETGTDALVSLMQGFVRLGGCFMQPDIVDSTVLREAQKNPENYQSLSIRVSGWNARFVTMDKQWQDMCIEQTEYGTL